MEQATLDPDKNDDTPEASATESDEMTPKDESETTTEGDEEK